MPGLGDITATALLNGLSSQPATAWPTAMYLGLFTAIGTDAGSGFTEVSGNAYARVQISGTVAIGTTQGGLGTTLTFSAVPSWVQPGMSVTNLTRADIPANTTVVSTTLTTVIISNATVSHVATISDNIAFSAFVPPAGGEPQTITTGSAITFPQATGDWGTVVAWGIFDASSSGNLWAWDYIGNYPWLPCYITSAAPAVWTVKGHGYFAADNFVYSNEVAGTLMSFSTGTFTLTGDGSTGVSPLLTVDVSPATDTFNAKNSSTSIATSSSGSGMVRKVIGQDVPNNAVVSITAGTLTLLGA